MIGGRPRVFVVDVKTAKAGGDQMNVRRVVEIGSERRECVDVVVVKEVFIVE